MNNFDEARKILGIKVSDMAEKTGIPYIALGKILKGEKSPTVSETKEIKFFLIKNYTDCIDGLS
jgi:predicted transcriptional regulator